MSTRSIIQVKDKAIYCHFDGYPEGVGAILNRFYTEKATVEKLIRGGAVRTLETDPEGNSRILEDDGKTPWIISSKKLRERGSTEDWFFAEYLYKYNPRTKQWDCSKVSCEGRLVKLTPEKIPHWRKNETRWEYLRRVEREREDGT